MEAFWRAARRIRTDSRLLVPLLLANVAGMAGGWYYYVEAQQFVLSDVTCSGGAAYCEPWWTWPLVADSPNAVALFFIAAIASRWFGWRSKWLDGAAFVLNVFVGLWTTFVFLAYASDMRTFEGGTNTVLFVTHMGMPLQALTLVPDLRRDAWPRLGLALAAVLLALYVAVDYAGPVLHPAPQLHPGDGLLHLVSPVLMAAAVAAWCLLVRPWRGASEAVDA